MPRLNGKFVSQAAYDEAMTTMQEEINTVDENNEFEIVVEAVSEVEKTDRRKGERPTTAVTKAAKAYGSALGKATRLNQKYRDRVAGLDDLKTAADDASAEAAAAKEILDAAVGNLAV